MQYKAANDNEQEKLTLSATIRGSSLALHKSSSISLEGLSRTHLNSSDDLGFSDAAFADDQATFSPFQNIETKMRSVFANADVNKDGVISYQVGVHSPQVYYMHKVYSPSKKLVQWNSKSPSHQEFLWAMTGMDLYLHGPAIMNDLRFSSDSPTHRSPNSSTKYSPIGKPKRRDVPAASSVEEKNGGAVSLGMASLFAASGEGVVKNNMLAVGDGLGGGIDRRRSTDGLGENFF